MAPTFGVDVVGSVNKVTVAAWGELDIASGPELVDAIVAAAELIPVVWIDLAAVTFMDSSGIAALVDACRRAQGASCVITAVSPQVDKVLELSGARGFLAVDLRDR